MQVKYQSADIVFEINMYNIHFNPMIKRATQQRKIPVL